MRKTSAVWIEKLRFGYGAAPVLELNRLHIPASSHTLICGESGCGKSTLLNLLAGILVPQSGRLEILGTALPQLSASARDRFRAAHIAVIFQQFNLIPYLSVLDNMLLALRIAGQKKTESELLAVLEHLQLAEAAKKKPAELSYGQKQRAAAARALVLDAELILADEPTSALDDTNARLFLDLLFREAETKNRTVVVISHDLRHRRRFDQVLNLAQLNRAHNSSSKRQSA